MPTASAPRRSAFRWLGPGLIMAAAGIGASDIVSATVGGATHGLALLWALALGAFLKFVLSEGIARWQLATGSTVMEGWAQHLPRWVLAVFGAYLLLWAVAVTGALTNGSGLAIENLTGGAVPRSWGAVAHCLVAFGFIYSAHAGGFARVMKPLIVLMFVAIVLCATLTFSEPVAMLKGLVIPAIPKGAGAYVLSLVGGIGGSVTLLAYSYLLKEEEGERPSLRAVRADLGIAYLFTAVFGLSVMLIANRVFFAAGVQISDADAVSRMADQLAHLIGPAGRLVYSFGFWAAVVASLFGVWQSVPFMIADCYALLRRLPEPERASLVRAGSLPYRAALTLMALSSIPFAFAGRPLLVIVAFTVLGSLFIPFLAATLLYLNNRIPFPAHVPRNHVMTNVVLVFVLALFLVVGGREIASIVSR